jgi:putative oxidoreductase
MKRFLFHAENYSSFALNLGLLIFRAAIGLTMAFAHGMGKIPPSSQFIGYVSSLGMPGFMAWGAALTEFVGGLLIAAGLLTRVNSALLGITMIVAAFMAHGADPFQKQEKALLYLVSCLLIFMAGPGKFSLDRIISNK